MKKWIWALLAIALLLPCMANAETAQDITADCLLNGRAYDAARPPVQMDHDDLTYYTGSQMTIEAPEGASIGALQLRWRTIDPPRVFLSTKEDGKWVECQQVEPDYAIQYVALDHPVESLLITTSTGKLELCEIQVYTPGEPGRDVQIWRDAPEKIDLMLFSTHPDDEVLWFGGLLPYYAGERDMDVLVVNAVFNVYYRRLELLDALWTCGVDIYPVMLGGYDVTRDVQNTWVQHDCVTYPKLVRLLRRYAPDVVVLHDEKGEYGHEAHIVFCRMAERAIRMAADAQYDASSAAQYGLWDVPKTYVHLYRDAQLRMDWNQPLSAFDGKTGLEVAADGFLCHVSQQGRGYEVVDGGRFDNALFGLWRTNVGDDVIKNDLFENIPARQR